MSNIKNLNGNIVLIHTKTGLVHILTITVISIHAFILLIQEIENYTKLILLTKILKFFYLI